MDRKYAFLMIEYDTPRLIKEIQGEIDEDDIYDNDDNEYGIETESHITLVPCLENDIDIDELKGMLEPLKKYEAVLTDVSVFECDNYDVLKCNAGSLTLAYTNARITERFQTHSEYKEYKPHMTIAYLKKGTAERYAKASLPSLVVLKPKSFLFSYFDKDGNEKHESFKS
ncbi:MAG: 2'-5' RNA ligase family protein [Paludibacteraceae bacterium]|nr:2'-5' RNA ligase family protein [Paludibacteraceae bacterium]